MLRPGDRLLLRRGQAWAGDLTVTASGTAERPISIGGYGRGPRAAIRGGLNCIVLTGSYVVIRGVWVDSCRFAGIRIIGSSNTVESSLITGNAVGVQVRPGAQGARILHNEIRDNNRMSRLTRTPNNDDSGAFGIVLAGEGAEVAYNTISGSDSFSYDYGRDGSAIEVFGGRDNWIHHNLAVDNHAFSELGGPGTANNTYSWNVVRASLSTAAFLTTRGTGGRYGPVLRTTLYHNTAYLTGSGSRGVSCSNGCGPSILRMRDNIVVAMQWAGSADAPFDENDDVFWGGSTKFQMGAASVFADPLFADPGNGNLRLQASSPAVDAGVDVGGSADFDGHPVPLDGNGDGMARPDIGAFEYVPGSG